MTRIPVSLLNISKQITRDFSSLLGAFYFVLSLYTVSGNDCTGNVGKYANDCYNNYNSQLINMQNSQHALFAGVDMETLRLFCSSYKEAMVCIRNLKARCPKDSQAQIDETLFVSFDGSMKELSGLCLNDSFYEVYARYRRCFEKQGGYSEECFVNNMKTSVRLLRRIDDKPIEELCSDMRNMLACIKPNIEMNCGSEAASLVDTLVKPMVRRSSQCDYKPQTTPKGGVTSRPGQTVQRSYGSGNGANTGHSLKSTINFTNILLTSILCLHSFLFS